MEKIYARFNWSPGWIADCPNCNKEPYDGTQRGRVAEIAKPGQPFVCSREYPDIHATMPMLYEGKTIFVPDEAKRKKAFERAQADGRVYEVVFPDDAKKIMRALQRRPRRAMNWWPGVTLEELKAENKEHK